MNTTFVAATDLQATDRRPGPDAGHRWSWRSGSP